jgi:hypothetical protein
MFVIEYSVNQRSWHISTVKEHLENNIKNCINGKSTDYQVIGYADTRKQAADYISKLKVSYKQLR